MGQSVGWQSPYFSIIFKQYDRADFAQEFLRRSPRYRAAYAEAKSLPRGSQGGRLAELADRWGLVFRLRP